MSTVDETTIADARARHLALLARGERHAALRDAARLLETGVPLEDFVLGVLAPVQVEIGMRWQNGRMTTAQERMATEVADILLTMAAARREHVVDGARLVMCVADREHHNLPARMVAELLRDLGHGVTFLGAARPRPGLDEMLARIRPEALVVSCSLTMNLPGVAALADVAHEHGIPVVAGGAAFGGDPRRAARVAADAHAGRVAEVADRVAAASSAPRAAVPDDPRALQYADLRAARDPLAAELTDRLLWRATPLLPRVLRTARPLRGYVSNYLRFVEAATLVDDRVLLDYTTWMRQRFAALRGDPALVPTLLELTRDRLAPDAPAAAAAADYCLVAGNG